MKRESRFKNRLRRCRQLIHKGVYSLKNDGMGVTLQKVKRRMGIGE